MARSKNNWDALVDYDGNYGVHVQEGIFPGSDGSNIKGTKGEPGRNGVNGRKGDKGPIGRVGGEGPAGAKGPKGDTGEKGDKLQFSDLNLLEIEQLKGAKGDHGFTGPPGVKGDQGTASPLLTFRGSFEFNNQFPTNGNQIGDVYYSEENGQYWAWDGAQFQPIGNPVKGEAGIGGEKGERGDQGFSAYEIAVQNGTILTEQQWLDSLKGNTGGPGSQGPKGEKGQRGLIGIGGQTGDVGAKGEKGEVGETLIQDLILDDYYDKDNVDQLIDGHFPPEYAFHYGYSSQPNNVISTGDVSFLNRDRMAPIYDPGPVLIKPTANIINFGAPPFEASQEMLIINYPWDDPQNSRSTQYQVVQVVYALGTGINRFEAYTRRCQPVTNFFSPWQPHTFNEAYYYTKLETDLLIRQNQSHLYNLVSENNLTDAFSSDLVLKDTIDGTTGDSGRVTIQGTNGIVVYRKDGKVTIDGQALSSGLNYIGRIGVGINPYAKFPAAVPGDFAIYSDTNSGSAWNGEQVTPGDWVIFSEETTATPEWTNLFVGQGAGVVSVDATGLLQRQGSLTNPIIHLDEDDVVTPDQLDDYPTWATISKIARLRRLGSLSDVSVGNDILGFGGFYDTEVSVFGVGIGIFYADQQAQLVQISFNDALNRSMIDFYNDILVDESVLRVTSSDLDWSYTTKVLNKRILQNGYELVFSDPNVVPLMKSATSGWNINIIENNTIAPNSTLMWDQYIEKWVAGPQMLDLFITDARYLRLDTGGTVNGDILCSTSVIAGEVLGGKNLEVQEAISGASGTLGTLADPFKGTDNNDIVTVGKLFDELAAYTPGQTGDYLPLTGGTLTGDLTLDDADMNFPRTGGNVILRAVGGNQQFAFTAGSDLSTLSDTFSIGSNFHNAFDRRIIGLGDAQEDKDALNRRSADDRFLQLAGGTMTGDIEFKDSGWTQTGTAGATLAYLNSQGYLSAPRLFSLRLSNWADNECLNYTALKLNFLPKRNPDFNGDISAADNGAFLTYNTTFNIGRYKTEPNLTFERSQVKLKTKMDVNGQELTNLKEPENAQDAATKQYVDRNGGGGGGAHLGDPSNLDRGSFVLSSSNVLSIVL
jgi:hypothetical protein